MNCIIWHRRDLRTEDNLALKTAEEENKAILPIFILDPYFFTQFNVCKSRLIFLFECLEDLNHQYQKLGGKLVIKLGNPINVLNSLQKELNIEIYANEDTNTEYGILRDIEVKKMGVRFFKNDAIQREGRKENWSEEAKKFFESQILQIKKIKFIEYTQNENEINKIQKLRNSLKPDKETQEKGGSTSAQNRLNEFIKILKYYPKSISKPSLCEDGYTSRLSAHFSFGTISLKRVYQEVQKTKIKQREFFISRLFWNQHFTQKIVKNPQINKEPSNKIFKEFYDEIYEPNEEIFEKWKSGQTGYPLVDASMRALNKTGFLNFRMRAMVASFLTYILKQPWYWGADYMFSQLMDADFGINYSQWQMQTGMVGVHPNRIYNPTKQILEHDEECIFIKRHVKELENTPIHLISVDPEEQSIFEWQYIKPIVKFSERSKWARETYHKINKVAFEYLQNNQNVVANLGLEEVSKNRLNKNQLPETKIV